MKQIILFFLDFFLIAVWREYKTIGDRTVYQSANNGYE